jgi:hypothetical protein
MTDNERFDLLNENFDLMTLLIDAALDAGEPSDLLNARAIFQEWREAYESDEEIDILWAPILSESV